MMLSSHLILCHPLLLLPSVFSNIGILSSALAHHVRWPKYWSFNFNISPSSEYSGLISFRMDRFDLLAVQGTLKVHIHTHTHTHTHTKESPAPQLERVSSLVLSLRYGPTLTSIRDYWKNHTFD